MRGAPNMPPRRRLKRPVITGGCTISAPQDASEIQSLRHSVWGSPVAYSVARSTGFVAIIRFHSMVESAGTQVLGSRANTLKVRRGTLSVVGSGPDSGKSVALASQPVRIGTGEGN